MSLLIIASGATSGIPFVIGLGGGTTSEKSTLATAIKSHYPILETKIIDYDYFQSMIDNGETVNYPDPTGTRSRAPYSTMTTTPGALLFLRESAQC